jgi:hypothetical protein
MPGDSDSESVISFYGDAFKTPEDAPPGQPTKKEAEDAPPGQPTKKEAEDAPSVVENAPSETLGLPDAPAIDVGAIANAAKGDMTMTIVLGVVALAGAGTTWKFLTQFSEQRHEQKMKQLDIQERSAGLGSASPQPCQATNAELRGEITDLKARLAAVEKKALSLSSDFDGEDVERQIKRLSKAVKALQEGANG